MRPYYDDGKGIVIYHGDCREVLPALGLPVDVLVIADPPYGVSERTDRKSKGRSNAAECYDFPPVAGDDEPFDPAPMLQFKRVVLWGANHFADRLPPSPSWLIWDKRDGTGELHDPGCAKPWPRTINIDKAHQALALYCQACGQERTGDPLRWALSPTDEMQCPRCDRLTTHHPALREVVEAGECLCGACRTDRKFAEERRAAA